MRAMWLVLWAALVAGCANPLNRVTSDRYTDECLAAERSDDLCLAEQLCYRALVNVDWGRLGPELKSERLYNLATIKRHLGKYDESEDLLKQALAIEETLFGPVSIKIGRRLAELSATLAQEKKWEEGMGYVERLMTFDADYTPSERAFLRALYGLYAKQARTMNRPDLAATLEARAAEPS